MVEIIMGEEIIMSSTIQTYKIKIKINLVEGLLHKIINNI